MIKIDAIVREEKFEDVKAALNAIGVNGITVSQVMGCGVQRGYKEIVRGMEVAVQMLPKIKFEIVVSSEEWEQKTSKPFRRQPLPEKSAMAKFSAMRFAPPRKSVPERLAMTHYRATIKGRID